MDVSLCCVNVNFNEEPPRRFCAVVHINKETSEEPSGLVFFTHLCYLFGFCTDIWSGS